MQPTVTVVIPCYNSERFIGDTIRSVRYQVYPNIRIIVVDDASTDNSVEEILKYKDGVELIRNMANVGSCATVNDGFRLSTSDYTCLLASDDRYMNAYHILDHVKFMTENNLDWCYDNRYLVGESPETARTAYTRWFAHQGLDNTMMEFPSLCCLKMTISNPVNSSTMMIKTKSFRENNLSWYPRKRSICDGYLIADMFQKGLRGGATNYCNVFYRIHPDQMSNGKIHKCENKKFRKEMYRRVLGLS